VNRTSPEPNSITPESMYRRQLKQTTFGQPLGYANAGANCIGDTTARAVLLARMIFQPVLRLSWKSACPSQRTILLSKPVIPILGSMFRTQNADEYGNAYVYGGQRDDALRIRPKISRAVLSSASSIDLHVSVVIYERSFATCN
jgi:hypothetical protein